MSLPPLYKFLGVEGAKLTLASRTFKHAKPSDFNDTEDLTAESIFPEGTETALKLIAENFVDVLMKHLHDPPTCASPMKEKLALIQHALRQNPHAAELLKADLTGENAKPIYDVNYMRERSVASIAEINEFMQGYRILCVSIHNTSERMWCRYADGHQGVALRIQPNTKKDSKFQLFSPIVYRERRPPLYESVIDFLSDGLFGNRDRYMRSLLDKIVYAKTLEWEYEGEYRLAIPTRQGEEEWNTLSFHPEEITELYLGLAMERKISNEVERQAREMNPGISVFRARRNECGQLDFDQT
jgi:hypothetical protein